MKAKSRERSKAANGSWSLKLKPWPGSTKTSTKRPLRNSSLILRPSKKGLLNWRAISKNSTRTIAKLPSVLLLNKSNNRY
jgi:hypothetical protein